MVLPRLAFLVVMATSVAAQLPIQQAPCTIVKRGHITPYHAKIKAIIPPIQPDGQLDIADLCVNNGVSGMDLQFCDHNSAPSVKLAPNYSVADIIRMGYLQGPSKVNGTIYCTYGKKSQIKVEFLANQGLPPAEVQRIGRIKK